MPLAFAVNEKGILPDRMIATLVADGAIRPAAPLAPEQIQPASLDLRLADVAFRVSDSSRIRWIVVLPASFGPRTTVRPGASSMSRSR